MTYSEHFRLLAGSWLRVRPAQDTFVRTGFAEMPNDTPCAMLLPFGSSCNNFDQLLVFRVSRRPMRFSRFRSRVSQAVRHSPEHIAPSTHTQGRRRRVRGAAPRRDAVRRRPARARRWRRPDRPVRRPGARRRGQGHRRPGLRLRHVHGPRDGRGRPRGVCRTQREVLRTLESELVMCLS